MLTDEHKIGEGSGDSETGESVGCRKMVSRGEPGQPARGHLSGGQEISATWGDWVGDGVFSVACGWKVSAAAIG